MSRMTSGCAAISAAEAGRLTLAPEAGRLPSAAGGWAADAGAAIVQTFGNFFARAIRGGLEEAWNIARTDAVKTAKDLGVRMITEEQLGSFTRY